MTRTTQSLPFSRWWLVIVGAMIMGIAGTFQFLWSSIRGPIGVQIGASEATLGTLFTVLIAAQTLSQFPAGWFRDRFGPRLPLFSSGILFAGGYIGLTLASSFVHAVIAVIFGGIGSGIAYTVAVNTPVKWFDEHRGIATGIVAMSYSGLSFVLIPVVRGNIVGSFDSTLFIFGGIGAITALVGAIILRDPTSTTQTTTTDTAEPNTEVSYTWRETIQTWQFWLLYGIFIIVNGVGLMLIGKVISFADTVGLSPATATTAASIIALAEGGGVVIVGAISDRFDPIQTIGTALLLSATGIAIAVFAGQSNLGIVFIGGVALASFFRSPVFAVFPGLIGEYYGPSHSSENYAALYTGKLWGSIFGGIVTSTLVITLGWSQTFILGAGLLGIAGVAMFFIKPVADTDGS